MWLADPPSVPNEFANAAATVHRPSPMESVAQPSGVVWHGPRRDVEALGVIAWRWEAFRAVAQMEATRPMVFVQALDS